MDSTHTSLTRWKIHPNFHPNFSVFHPNFRYLAMLKNSGENPENVTDSGFHPNFHPNSDPKFSVFDPNLLMLKNSNENTENLTFRDFARI